RAADEGDVAALPFAGAPHRVHPRREEAVDAPGTFRAGRLAEVIVDLELVTPAEVDSAVAPGGVPVFGVKLEVGEGELRDDVAALRRVYHLPVTRRPLALPPAARPPAGKIPAVEERNRLTPLRDVI